jgi:hypothetical protein
VLFGVVLAGCDLPAGTPPQVGDDRAPNDTQAEAPVVAAPRTVTGSVGPLDPDDWFEVANPSTTSQVLWETCESGAIVMGIRVEHVEGPATGIIECRPGDGGKVINAFGIEPGDRAWVHVEPLPDTPFSHYSIALEYRPVDEGRATG